MTVFATKKQIENGRIRWATKNDCNGIFEVFDYRQDAQAAVDAGKAGDGGYVCPVVVIDVRDNGTYAPLIEAAKHEQDYWRS